MNKRRKFTPQFKSQVVLQMLSGEKSLAELFVYLAVIMNVFTRAIRGWQLSRSLDRELTLTALRRALAERVPLIHHSDQGASELAPIQWRKSEETGRLRGRSAAGGA